MPTTNIEFKDGLRIQRDYLQEIVDLINAEDYDKAKAKAEAILKRINESLQD